MTREVAGAVCEAVEPAGVGVVVEASHMCMVMRGVQKINSKTVTRYQTLMHCRSDYLREKHKSKMWCHCRHVSKVHTVFPSETISSVRCGAFLLQFLKENCSKIPLP